MSDSGYIPTHQQIELQNTAIALRLARKQYLQRKAERAQAQNKFQSAERLENAALLEVRQLENKLLNLAVSV